MRALHTANKFRSASGIQAKGLYLKVLTNLQGLKAMQMAQKWAQV